MRHEPAQRPRAEEDAEEVAEGREEIGVGEVVEEEEAAVDVVVVVVVEGEKRWRSTKGGRRRSSGGYHHHPPLLCNALALQCPVLTHVLPYRATLSLSGVRH